MVLQTLHGHLLGVLARKLGAVRVKDLNQVLGRDGFGQQGALLHNPKGEQLDIGFLRLRI